MATALEHRNRKVGTWAALIALGALALGFASVPLYRMFCQVTGFAGTTQRAEAYAEPAQVSGRMLTVRFDANINNNLPWKFMPEQETQRAAVGARKMAFFTATNLTDKPVTGRAVFNVTPSQTGQYFTKIECFCFTQQTLKPHETVRMPVIYYIDPKFVDDETVDSVKEITLSYTFYPSTDDEG